MRDYLFEEILDRRGNVTRPTVRIYGDRLPHEPEFSLVTAAVPLRLRPVRAALDAGLLGAFPRAEAVGYAFPGDLRTYDRVGIVQGITTLRQDADQGTTSLLVANPAGLAPGQRVHLRDMETCEEALVTAVTGSTLTLADPLATGFAQGANVERIESWEVLGVEEADGSGHHLRLALRKRV